MRRPAFSLLELIVVLAIAGVLAALIFAGVQRARFAAGRADCQNRLRNQVAAILHYESHHGRLPPGSISGPFEPRQVPDQVNHGLWPALLSELGEAHLAEAYDFTVNYDDPKNHAIAKQKLGVLECPRLPADRQAAWQTGIADFAAIEVNAFLADIGQIDPAANFESALPVNGVVTMQEIHDGASNTFLVVETAGRPGIGWTEPNTVSLKSIIGGRAHLGGANVSFCDGSVRFLHRSTDLKLLARYATRAGGETVDE